MPLDEDALTVADLFELASRVLEILYPFPTSLRFEPVEPVDSGAEDARNLLRGILHGCDVLEPYLKDGRRVEMEQAKLDALGLGEAGVAAVHLRYLQAFALRHLGELFQPAPPVAVVAGSKRRKVDLREPQSASEWFNAAEERLSGVYKASDSILAVLLAAERAHLLTVSSPSPDLSDFKDRLAGVVASLGSLDPESTSPTSADVTDAWYAALRALTASVVALEGIRDPDALCSVSASSVDVPLCSSFEGVVQPPLPVLGWLREVLMADVQLARFGIAEDWIEARYRADADEEEDGEVAALPDEAKPFVEVVREYGRQGAFASVVVWTGSVGKLTPSFPTAIASLRSTLAGEIAHPSARTAQYRKVRRRSFHRSRYLADFLPLAAARGSTLVVFGVDRPVRRGRARQARGRGGAGAQGWRLERGGG